MKKLASIVLAVALLTTMLSVLTLSAAAETLQGAGTKNSPYLIQDENGWKTFVSFVKATGGEGQYFRLENDIGSFGDEITDYVDTFRGDFDGNGKTVYFSIVHKKSLFYKNYGVIHDLTVDGEQPNFANITVGGICSYNYGTLNRCINRADIIGDAHIAGICGENSGIIANSINYGNISPSVTGGMSTFAGVCSTINKGAYLVNCINAGNVTGPEYTSGICNCVYGGDDYTPFWLCGNCGLPTETSSNGHYGIMTNGGPEQRTVPAKYCRYVLFIDGVKCEATDNYNFIIDPCSPIANIPSMLSGIMDRNAMAEAAEKFGIAISYWDIGDDGLPVLTNRAVEPSSTGSVLSAGSIWIIVAVAAIVLLGGVATLVFVRKKKKPALASEK